MILENQSIIKIEYFKIKSEINPKNWARGENKEETPVKNTKSIAIGTNGKTNIFAIIDIILTAPKLKIIRGRVTIWALKVSKNSLSAAFSFCEFSKKYSCKSGDTISTPKNDAKDNCHPKFNKFAGLIITVIAATKIIKK